MPYVTPYCRKNPYEDLEALAELFGLEIAWKEISGSVPVIFVKVYLQGEWKKKPIIDFHDYRNKRGFHFEGWKPEFAEAIGGWSDCSGFRLDL